MQNAQRNKTHLNQAQMMIMVIEEKGKGFSTDPSLPSNTSPACKNYLVNEAAVDHEIDRVEEEEEEEEEHGKGDLDQVVEHDGRAAEVELDVGDRRKRNRMLLSDQEMPEGKKLQRLQEPNIIMEEDVALCKAFVSVTIRDAMAGSQLQQQTSTFWGRVLEAFDMLYPDGYYSRPVDTLQHMFGAINNEVNKFRDILVLVESRRQSGRTDADLMQQARSQFRARNNNKDFKFEDCYNVLKELQKFSLSSTTMKTGFSQEIDRICSSSIYGAHTSNLNDSAINSEVPLERNPEREVEEERSKKKEIGSDGISTIMDEARAQNACYMERTMKKRSEINKQLAELEREEHYYVQWKRNMDKKLLREIEVQKHENRILSMDLSTRTDGKALYFKFSNYDRRKSWPVAAEITES